MGTRADWTGLAAAPFRPLRPMLQAASEHLRPWFARESGAKDADERDEIAAEAWESCASAGLVPVEWLSSERRWVRVDPAIARRVADSTLDLSPPNAIVTLDHPPSVGACVAMAADPAGVLAAEQLARAVSAALSPWRAGRAAPATVWRLDRLDPEVNATLMSPYSAARNTIPYEKLALRGERAFARALGARAPSGWPLFIARLAKQSEYLDALLEYGSECISVDGEDVTVTDRRNPFHRAAELFATGYGVELSQRHNHLRIVTSPAR